MLRINDAISLEDCELGFTYVRSSGPGGQNVNKVATKAVLRWSPGRSVGLPPAVKERFLALHAGRLTTSGELVITCDRHRSQRRNAEECLERLRQLVLRVAAPPKKRKATRPTRASQQRRLEAKRARGRAKRERRGGWQE